MNELEQRNHYFFAIRIPEETKLIMKNHIEQFRKDIPFSRWVHYRDIHITLAFLGAAPYERLLAAEKNVKEAIQDAHSFTLKMDTLGIFGVEASPRVFWADTGESQELQTIRKKVFTACEAAGFQLETRPFRPHITLARKWNSASPFQKEFLDVWNERQPEPLHFQVSDVVLYQTHLNKTPKYEAIKVFSLQI